MQVWLVRVRILFITQNSPEILPDKYDQAGHLKINRVDSSTSMLTSTSDKAPSLLGLGRHQYEL